MQIISDKVFHHFLVCEQRQVKHYSEITYSNIDFSSVLLTFDYTVFQRWIT